VSKRKLCLRSQTMSLYVYRNLKTFHLIKKEMNSFHPVTVYHYRNRWSAYLICYLVGSHCDVLHWHVCHLAGVQVCCPSCGLKLYALGSEGQKQEVKVERPLFFINTHKQRRPRPKKKLSHGNLPPGIWIWRNSIIIIQPNVAQIIFCFVLWVQLHKVQCKVSESLTNQNVSFNFCIT